MALPTARGSREYSKFVENAAGDVAVRVVATDASGNDALKLEDTAHSDGDSGTPIFAVRKDATGSLVDTDGDYAPLQVDANGNLKVNATGVAGTEFNEDSAHNSGDAGSMILAVRADSDASLVDTDGDYAPLQVDDLGMLKVISPDMLQTEDTAYAGSEDGVPLLAVRTDSNTSRVSTDGDWEFLQTDDMGQLRTNVGFSKQDDSAYSTASEGVGVIGGYYSTADDTVNSGDVGVLAMTENRHLKAQVDGYDSSTDSIKSFEVSPLNLQYQEAIEDFTNVANGTPAEHIIDMNGYKGCSLQWVKDAGVDTYTVTVEAAVADPDEDVDNADFQDVTQFSFTATHAATAASYTADGGVYLNIGANFRYVKLVITTAGGNNDADFAVFSKRWY